jgi:hypothetical protein
METEQIIYLVAFALILRIIYRLIVRYRQENNNTSKQNDTE